MALESLADRWRIPVNQANSLCNLTLPPGTRDAATMGANAHWPQSLEGRDSCNPPAGSGGRKASASDCRAWADRNESDIGKHSPGGLLACGVPGFATDWPITDLHFCRDV